ncbi:MAG: LssY C-terminal domain-containing protein [Acidobacteria bacterium]|nr:LssY C-terminal domain-containing protein [Acidobacteriota bacterium]
MARVSSLLRGSAAVWLLVCGGAVAAIQVPTGTQLGVRLTTKVSTLTAKAKDPVEAVVVTPVVIDGQFLVPAGSKVRGIVEKTANSTKPDERSTLLLSFNEAEIEGAKYKVAARVAAVDNARETIGDDGTISGILTGETISGRIDAGLSKLAEKASGFADVLATVKKAVLTAPESDITYEAGTDLSLVLTAPLELKKVPGPGPAAKLEPVSDEDALYALVNRQPFQTWAESPSKPSDITNIMLIGTKEAITQAFHEAGWAIAAGLSTDSKFETFRAIASQRGYKEAPVSILLLEQHPPEMVFEKLTNTFAQRHHLRVWSRPDTFEGKPVWVVAATHDTGIDFSEQNRTFIHKIDSNIDRERAKVVNDLLFTGRVRSIELVERPKVPTSGQNATGDNLITDAKMAVLIFQ